MLTFVKFLKKKIFMQLKKKFSHRAKKSQNTKNSCKKDSLKPFIHEGGWDPSPRSLKTKRVEREQMRQEKCGNFEILKSTFFLFPPVTLGNGNRWAHASGRSFFFRWACYLSYGRSNSRSTSVETKRRRCMRRTTRLSGRKKCATDTCFCPTATKTEKTQWKLGKELAGPRNYLLPLYHGGLGSTWVGPAPSINRIDNVNKSS